RGLVQVVAPLGQFVDGGPFDVAERLVVGVVVGLDDLEGPVSGDDVAAQHLGAHRLGPVRVAGLVEQFDRAVQIQVGGAGELVEAVQVAAGALGSLQCLRQRPERLHGLRADALGTLVGAVGPVVVTGHRVASVWVVVQVPGARRSVTGRLCPVRSRRVSTRWARAGTGLRRSAARAALAPGAPCTPPPGCADADARYRPGTGVSGRAVPGSGRKNSCWCMAAVPPLMAPPCRLRSMDCRVGGARMRRARMRERKPGANRSTCRSTRSAMTSCSLASQDPVSPSSAASPATSCGTWVYAHADSVPRGERDGSEVVIWPNREK